MYSTTQRKVFEENFYSFNKLHLFRNKETQDSHYRLADASDQHPGVLDIFIVEEKPINFLMDTGEDLSLSFTLGLAPCPVIVIIVVSKKSPKRRKEGGRKNEERAPIWPTVIPEEEAIEG